MDIFQRESFVVFPPYFRSKTECPEMTIFNLQTQLCDYPTNVLDCWSNLDVLNRNLFIFHSFFFWSNFHDDLEPFRRLSRNKNLLIVLFIFSKKNVTLDHSYSIKFSVFHRCLLFMKKFNWESWNLFHFVVKSVRLNEIRFSFMRKTTSYRLTKVSHWEIVEQKKWQKDSFSWMKFNHFKAMSSICLYNSSDRAHIFIEWRHLRNRRVRLMDEIDQHDIQFDLSTNHWS